MKVVMIPWLAHGHLTPFLELAKKLAKRNFQIYLCSTPINLKSIRKRITDEYSVSITLVEFHLPSTPELPPHYHTTNGLPFHLKGALGIALDTAGPNLISNILRTLTPDLVIYDIRQPWVQTVSSSSNIPAVGFITHGANPACRALQLSPQQAEKYGDPQFSQRYRDALGKSFKILLCNTFRGIEGKYIDCLAGLLDKKIVPAGFVVEEEEAVAAMDDIEEEPAKNILRWLGEKQESSTVFVSFGSECYLSNQEIKEIAHGLELSKVNFIWVVRFPHHGDDGGKENKTTITSSSIQEALPEGFLQRVGERGLVVEGWAPQAKILAHPSTGGFVSHCGWNSTIESLKYGVPVIAVPMHIDQPLNAKLLVEIGTAVEMKRSADEDGRRLDRQDIAQVVKKVVVDKSGEELRIKAREFSMIAKTGGEKQIDDLVQELTQIVQTTKLI